MIMKSTYFPYTMKELPVYTVKKYFPSCKSFYIKSGLQGSLTDCRVHILIMFAFLPTIFGDYHKTYKLVNTVTS